MTLGVFRLRSRRTYQATGFLISPRLVLTAAHCVEPKGEAHLDNKVGSFKGEAVTVWWDTQHDAALLAVENTEGIDLGKHAIVLRSLPNGRTIADLRWHAPGYAVGDPERLGLELTGALCAIQSGDGFRRLQLSCDQFGNVEGGIEGSSGSPVFVNMYAIALISRSPKAFAQKVVYGTLIEDALRASRDKLEPDYRNELDQVLARLAPLELDEYDRTVNRYVARLHELGRAFHERAVRTPKCSTRYIEQACLEATYVPVSLQHVREARELWVESEESTCPCTSAPLEAPVPIAGAIRSMKTNGTRLQTLISGYAGSGKTTLLNYIATKALFFPAEIGLEEPMTPLLLSLPELARANCTSTLAEWLLAVRQSGACASELLPDACLSVSEFPNRLNAPLLVLLDGLEEVPEQFRHDLWRSFRRCIAERGISWIMASRPPTSHEDPVNDISQRPFVSTYKILPWTDKELRQFVASVLGKENAEDFLRQFSLMAVGRSTMTPLLALIAMCVYEEDPDRIPRTRAELFELFVENAILTGIDKQNARQTVNRDERDELVELLAEVALFATEYPEHSQADDVLDFLGKAIKTRHPRCSSRALAKRARQVLERAGLQSGLLATGELGRVVWWHASLREYLAARALADGPEEVRLARLETAKDPQWLETVVMMLVILSVRHRQRPGRGPDVTKYFKVLVKQGDTGMVVYPALAEGAVVDDEMEAFIIENLVNAAIKIGQIEECQGFNEELASQDRSPIQLLMKLRKRTPRAVEGIVCIRDHPDVLDWMRKDAREALAQIEYSC